tara:strand:- start:554 stop:1258 length:705 start_codon:yes stop_codon:yes gene_type:complete
MKLISQTEIENLAEKLNDCLDGIESYQDGRHSDEDYWEDYDYLLDEADIRCTVFDLFEDYCDNNDIDLPSLSEDRITGLIVPIAKEHATITIAFDYGALNNSVYSLALYNSEYEVEVDFEHAFDTKTIEALKRSAAADNNKYLKQKVNYCVSFCNNSLVLYSTYNCTPHWIIDDDVFAMMVEAIKSYSAGGDGDGDGGDGDGAEIIVLAEYKPKQRLQNRSLFNNYGVLLRLRG